MLLPFLGSRVLRGPAGAEAAGPLCEGDACGGSSEEKAAISTGFGPLACRKPGTCHGPMHVHRVLKSSMAQKTRLSGSQKGKFQLPAFLQGFRRTQGPATSIQGLRGQGSQSQRPNLPNTFSQGFMRPSGQNLHFHGVLESSISKNCILTRFWRGGFGVPNRKKHCVSYEV